MGCSRCPGSSTPKPSCGANCFKAKNDVVNCEDAAAPGGSGSKDLTTINTSFNGCSNDEGPCDVTYQLVSFSAEFSSVTISEAGLVEYTFSPTATPNTLGTIRYRVYCTCAITSASAKLYVCVKDLCANQLCDEDFACNPQNGLCEPVVPNAILS